MMSKLPLTVSSAILLAGVAAGCTPDVPANPTYTKDVQPIFMAHCVRCHGANDMLNAMMVPNSSLPIPPSFCYLQRYEDEGACTSAIDCMFGAGSMVCTMQVPQYITMPADGLMRMPPPPSEPLSDWEKDVITRWAKNGAPK